MGRGLKRVLLYGGLLAAGAALGMQLVSGDPAGGYTNQAGSPANIAYAGTSGNAGTAGTSGTAGNAAAGQGIVQTNTGKGYEQGAYVKLPDGTTFYYVQNPGTLSGAVSPPSTLPQVTAGSGSAAGNTGNSSGVSQPYQTPGQILLSPAPQTSVDRFADKTGELLQNVSQKGINWVVSLFGSLTD